MTLYFLIDRVLWRVDQIDSIVFFSSSVVVGLAALSETYLMFAIDCAKDSILMDETTVT